jgi:CheY-like chemotaxis protein
VAKGEGLFGLGGRRLLLVEDDEGCAAAMREWLEICGAQVTTAGSVVAALGRLAAQAPDLVVVDVYLPDGTAWELLEQLRARAPGAAGVPVIAITGKSRAAVAGAAAAHGVRHVVTKPIAPEALAHALSACLADAA